MARWHLYVGTFTSEFVQVVERLRNSDNQWERAWVGGGTRSSGWKPDTAAPGKGTQFSEGIERFLFDDQDGSLHHVETVRGNIANPQSLVAHPQLPVIYAAEYTYSPRLLALALDGKGAVYHRSAVDTGGQLAISVAVHPTGAVAYVAHWGDGTLTACPLDGDGMLMSAEVVVRGDPREESDQFSRHHQVRTIPSGHGVLVTDVGRDELTVYETGQDGSLRPDPVARIAFPSRSGPRHVEFHPSGRWVYVVDERGSTMHVLEAVDGLPTKILASYPTVPPGYEGNNRPSELHLRPDGKSLYVGNRGLDAVTIYAVDDNGGATTLGYQPGMGGSLSSVRVDPSGRYLLTGCMLPGSFGIFEIGDDGRLRPQGGPTESAAPRSFVFVTAAD